MYLFMKVLGALACAFLPAVLPDPGISVVPTGGEGTVD